MSPTELAIAGAAAATALAALWLFLGPRPKEQSLRSASGVIQEALITVRNGFYPDTVVVEAGKPVKLLFYRDETADQSARIVLEGLGIEQPLAAFSTTVVTFTPKETGDYRFRGDSGSLEGRIVALSGREAARSNLGRGHSKHG